MSGQDPRAVSPGAIGSGVKQHHNVLASRYHEKVLHDLAKRNKRCADCLKPAPNFANLSLGSFVCLECSGILREFGFRIKGLGLSSFTPQEVQMLDLSGGNKRVNEIYLGKHGEGEKATPGWENIDVLKHFLSKKYCEKRWYDENAARKSAEPVRSRADSSSSLSSLLESPSSTGGRKRVGSRDSVIRGSNALKVDSHRSFLAATHARAAGRKRDPAQDISDDYADETKESSEEDEMVATPEERERAVRDMLRKKLMEFYTIHNPEKLDSLDVFIEWILCHGMPAFNKKLRERYGTDIEMKTKKVNGARTVSTLDPEVLERAGRLQEREELARVRALHDLASRKRAGSTNPFDDEEVSSSTETDHSSNPFDDLMFL